MSKSISADAVYAASPEQAASLPKGSIASRMLSRASEFAAQTNDTPAYAGASADLRTMEPMKSGVVVGSARDFRTKAPYPSQMVEPGHPGTRPTITGGDVLHARRDMLPAAKDAPEASIGSWLEGPSTYRDGVALDLGDVFTDRRKAQKEIVRRNEDAGYDLGAGRSISFEQARYRERASVDQGPRPPKAPGQVTTMRERGGAAKRYAP